MRKAILFDLDGTLLDTLDDLADSLNYALTAMNCPTHTREKVCSFIGNGASKLVERAMPEGASADDLAQCLLTFQGKYRENLDNKTRPYDGVMDMLHTLKAQGIRMGVVSNKFDAAVAPLCQKHFPNLFDVAIGENESAGLRRKPAPDMVDEALRRMNVDANGAIYVGDSPVDIKTASASNLPAILVCWGFSPRAQLVEAGAQYIIDEAAQFIPLFEGLQ